MEYKRKKIIINKSFQFKLCFIFCSLVFISTLIYPVAIYDIFEKFTSLLGGSSEQFVEQRNNLFMYLIAIQSTFMILMVVICLLVSHRIAGPMYKLTKYLAELREGKEVGELYFREGDYFPEVADEINKTIKYLNSKANK
jgi:hypothetical protein